MIGITLGEYSGIGFEILAKSIDQLKNKSLIMYGDQNRFEAICQKLLKIDDLIWF